MGLGTDYRAVFDAVPGLYLLLDRDLTIITANSAYCGATMTEAAAISGRPLFEVFPDNPGDPAADGVRNLRTSLARVLSLKKPDAMPIQKYDIRSADGTFEERHWSPLNTPVLGPDGEVSLIIHRVTDVSHVMRLQKEGLANAELARGQLKVIDELRRALEENSRLAAHQRYLANIVESSNDAIVARSPNGLVVSWNKAAARMFGYDPEEIVGLSADILAPPDRKGETDQVFKRLKPGDSAVHFETVRLHKDGTPIQVSLTLSPVLDAQGSLLGASAIVRDITEQKRADERLKSLQAELIHLSRWNTMGMMASTLAHELNQPLTASVNYVPRRPAHHGGAGPGAAPRWWSSWTRRWTKPSWPAGIIRSLREFIDKREISRAPKNLNTVVEEAVALSMAGGPRIQGQAGREPGAAVARRCWWTKIQIEQVLLNLIRNALDAMEDMPVRELAITTTPDEPGFVRVSLADSGPGIAPRNRSQAVPALCHQQGKRHGHRADDLPVHHRGAWRAHLGRKRPRRGISCPAAGRQPRMSEHTIIVIDDHESVRGSLARPAGIHRLPGQGLCHRHGLPGRSPGGGRLPAGGSAHAANERHRAAAGIAPPGRHHTRHHGHRAWRCRTGGGGNAGGGARLHRKTFR